MASAAIAAPLALLCAGAAQGLVEGLQGAFEATGGRRLEARFGAVGALREALESGTACDVIVLTHAMVQTLVARGDLVAGSEAPLGRVRTGIAVRSADTTRVQVDSAAALETALRAADRICFPDPVRSTAGIHFAGVLRRLGIADALAARLATFANGAAAMRALAVSTDLRPIGCTQISEILSTPGVRLVGPLPTEFELATVYTAAVASGARDPAAAADLVARLGGTASAEARRVAGFES